MGHRFALPAGLVAVLAAGLAAAPRQAAVADPRPAASVTTASRAAVSVAWHLTPTGSTQRFRGLAAVSRQVAWVAGTAGTVLRTVDGGRSWQDVSPVGAQALQFRDIEALDARHAVALTIGNGADSRVYRTTDGGLSWQLAFGNDDEAAFYDCVAFADPLHGLALSDPVGGAFRILATSDGGRTWRVRSPAGMPAALDGEFAFAASGTCLVGRPGGQFWFATGGGARARVFRTADSGRHWQVSDTPVASGPTAGIYSLAFGDRRHGIAVGGDFTTPGVADRAAATTSDGGRTWTLVPAGGAPAGYRSGAAWLSFVPFAVAVGPTGSELSLDAGRTWRGFDTGSFDSVECGPLGGCWASGEQGRVAVLR
jgi:photosystem II stability/assembly factor-like uncharacterized protein